jgi:hypothetical protein
MTHPFISLQSLLLEIEQYRREESDRALFDAYAFADYRGARDDGAGVVLFVALGSGPARQVTDVRNRRTLEPTWHQLVESLSKRGLRLLFGQDHQYGIPRAFAVELGLDISNWRSGLRMLFSDENEWGKAATAGDAGRFAHTLNEALVVAGRPSYFWSATKATTYKIPANPPRTPIDVSVYRRTERGGGFPLSRVGDNGAVGGQTIVGLPRILSLLKNHPKVRVWPFDGIAIAEYARDHVMIEPYPTLVRDAQLVQSDENDAFASTFWAQKNDRGGILANALDLSALSVAEQQQVMFEGWIAGATP